VSPVGSSASLGTKPLEGRAAIITGANQGIGLAIARAYADAGADLMLCARDGVLLDAAREDVARLAAPPQRVLTHACDVSKPDDVVRLVSMAVSQLSRIHILVNNAGVQGPVGRTEDVDWAAWTKTIEINLFGSVLMCREVVPHFKASGGGKIVQLSGGGATGPMPRVSAYAASKAAVVRFVETLAEEVKGDGIDVNAIAPGAVNTRLLTGMLDAGADRLGRDLYDRAVRQKNEGGAPPERAAALAVYLASEAADGITGKLISAIWDPWESLAEHRTDLQTTEVYALRRIVPADRGMAWGANPPKKK
jgi:NAD(P)-dependent dehydrogenase (short-subunit alcohol dehydrogenase family)